MCKEYDIKDAREVEIKQKDTEITKLKEEITLKNKDHAEKTKNRSSSIGSIGRI